MKSKEITGKIYDVQGFSVQDGPGIRTTVFLKGCPLRCPWCHSPESQLFETELNWLSIRCIGIDLCGKCLEACHEGCISPGPESVDAAGNKIVFPVVDKSNCTECGLCAKACKAEALYMCGTDMTVEEVIQRIRRDIPFYEDSGGGVTISGGECLSQPEFTIELLRQCKAMGVHTAVDTTGYVPWSIIKLSLPYTDLFLYDLKCMDSALHKQVIGVPNELVLDNAVKISEAGGKLHIRIPVMPMYNDSKEHFDKYISFLNRIRDAVVIVQLLPYHKMGLSKYDRLLRKGKYFIAEPPTDELMLARKVQLEQSGFNVRIH